MEGSLGLLTEPAWQWRPRRPPRREPSSPSLAWFRPKRNRPWLFQWGDGFAGCVVGSCACVYRDGLSLPATNVEGRLMADFRVNLGPMGSWESG